MWSYLEHITGYPLSITQPIVLAAILQLIYLDITKYKFMCKGKKLS